MKSAIGYAVCAVASVTLLALSLTGRIPMDWTEVVAFVTGAWGVWLTVREHIWNWPIGIANATFSGIVFFEKKLYSDSGLQVVYLVLSVIGWYWWLYGGTGSSPLKVSRMPRMVTIGCLLAGILGTLLLRWVLIKVNGAAPLLDATTTSFSLVAQFMLTRKYIENWIVWIAVDIIYVPLYVDRHIYLMAILYAVFLVLAVMGWIEWKKSMESARLIKVGE